MSKKLFVGSIIIFLCLISIFTGYYPVAVVDGSLVFFITWRKMEDSVKYFANIELRSAGQPLIDFSGAENRELLLSERRDTLTFLIEDALIAAEGRKLVRGFKKSAASRTKEAVGNGYSMAEAARISYNLDFDDFQKLVLLPQARSEILLGVFQERGLDFAGWLQDSKRNKKVFLLFTPFSWNGEGVK